MTTTSTTATGTGRDWTNTALTDALLAIAALVRGEPRFPGLSNVNVRRDAHSPSGYAITLDASGCGRQQAVIDTARTVAALFGPRATTRQSEPLVLSPDLTWHGLDVTSTLNGHTVTYHAWWNPATATVDLI